MNTLHQGGVLRTCKKGESYINFGASNNSYSCIDSCIICIMKKIDLTSLILILLVFAAIVFCADYIKKEETAVDDNIERIDVDLFSDDKYEIDEKQMHATIDVLNEGYDIFTCEGYGYRYGPSIMYYDDGSMDLWISSPGNNSTEWDYIRYMHSDDGLNWSNEIVVLRPTLGSLDHYSTCDPGVIYFNGYYYLGYTSTTNPDGYDNDIFVARSEYPDGPFEKWNGSGWGGDPVPIIDYTGLPEYWGVGEISFCIKNERLYCYYSYYGENASQTRVSVSDLSENWPANLQFKGIAFYRGTAEDSSDVVYFEDIDKFISLSIGKRLTVDSSIVIHESSDGINFDKTDEINENFKVNSHSVGISKKPDGSISLDDDLYIGYAYGDMGWGKWSACLQPIKIRGYMETN